MVTIRSDFFTVYSVQKFMGIFKTEIGNYLPWELAMLPLTKEALKIQRYALALRLAFGKNKS